jgi:hypothetical protein
VEESGTIEMMYYISNAVSLWGTIGKINGTPEQVNRLADGDCHTLLLCGL